MRSKGQEYQVRHKINTVPTLTAAIEQTLVSDELVDVPPARKGSSQIPDVLSLSVLYTDSHQRSAPSLQGQRIDCLRPLFPASLFFFKEQTTLCSIYMLPAVGFSFVFFPPLFYFCRHHRRRDPALFGRPPFAYWRPETNYSLQSPLLSTTTNPDRPRLAKHIGLAAPYFQP